MEEKCGNINYKLFKINISGKYLELRRMK